MKHFPEDCILSLYAMNRISFLKVREEIELENLAKMYLRHIIKKECWDSMIVKGCGVKGFHTPLVVTNYPMRERSPEELQELTFVTRQRKIECSEMELRKTILVAANNSVTVGRRDFKILTTVLFRQNIYKGFI